MPRDTFSRHHLFRTIEVLAKDFAHGHRIEEHSHDLDQLLYAYTGAMSVTTGEGAWAIPPQRGVWIPAGVSHSITMSGTVRMRTLYVKPGLTLSGVDQCRVLGIAPLDRELILELVRTAESGRAANWETLAQVLLDRITSLPVEPLHLPMPHDNRARRVAQAIIDRPELTRSLASIAKEYGVSARTLSRLFVKETGMSFGRWRQQLRLLASMRLLAQGLPVTTVSLEVGYDSPSAFIAMFRRALGVSPGKYYSGQA
jgi:AraC-like DNA-binding protein